jgi:hypothetical protein
VEGADHFSVTIALPGVAVGDCGALGTVRGTALTLTLAGPHPASLWATMRNTYFVPLTRLFTW